MGGDDQCMLDAIETNMFVTQFLIVVLNNGATVLSLPFVFSLFCSLF